MTSVLPACWWQTIDVLGDEYQLRDTRLERRQHPMPGIGGCAGSQFAAPGVPLPHQTRVTAEGFGRRQISRLILRPQTSLRLTKSGQAAFGGDARACQDGDMPCAAQSLGKMGRNGQDGFVDFHTTIVPDAGREGCFIPDTAGQRHVMTIASVNPATGENLKAFTPLTADQVEEKLALAAAAYQSHRRTTFAERAARMRGAADILDAEKDAIGRTMTLEVGKTLKSSIEEVEKCARCCRYYADNAEAFLADETIEMDGALSFIRYQPLGPVIAVMPWNFPLWQVFRFAVPALMAGNVGLLKHAENVPQCALAIEDVFRRAGFAPGVLQALLIEKEQFPAVLDDPRIVAATLTGSAGAGSMVAAQAGRRIKKTVLELGGSDPFIVMPSADLDMAVTMAVKARVLNNGQSCIAAKRFIVAEAIADEFERRFVDGMETLRVGNPMDADTDVGPLAMPRLLDTLESQVQKSIAAGARLLTGGYRLNRPGNFYAPTILTDIPTDAPAYHEELFGPVALLFRVPDIDAAIRQANDTPFGLGSSVWTQDETEQQRFIDEIEAGMVFVNSMVASDPRLPFGGIKHSGYGRELSAIGIREFVNAKTINIASVEDRKRKAEMG